ncbi:hypothetical protein TUN199_11158 [Pyrenophora tritici-repentis]|nr:hypothetical protein PtrV1_06473 [Pyrenophora tritici-repentis]KAI0604531.1 hypothetical protein TUN205_11222 [Pyrenophora tritici-repentis]KAI0616851.1 hypothetical protein TUN199_11158 [Pyrenophora tritici-repentis]
MLSKVHEWDQSYCEGKFKFWDALHSQQVLEQWRAKEYQSIEKNRKAEKAEKDETICLIEAAYGLRFAWILSNFPNLSWYFHEKRRHAGAAVLGAFLKFAEAQCIAPTASRSCQTEILPRIPAAVKDGDSVEAQASSTRPSIAPTASRSCQTEILPRIPAAVKDGDSVEAQASSTRPSIPSTSLRMSAKRPLADSRDEDDNGHSEDQETGVQGVAASQDEQYRNAKRVCPTFNEGSESSEIRSGEVILPLDSPATSEEPAHNLMWNRQVRTPEDLSTHFEYLGQSDVPGTSDCCLEYCWSGYSAMALLSDEETAKMIDPVYWYGEISLSCIEKVPFKDLKDSMKRSAMWETQSKDCKVSKCFTIRLRRLGAQLHGQVTPIANVYCIVPKKDAPKLWIVPKKEAPEKI